MKNTSIISFLVLSACGGLTPEQVAPLPSISVDRAFSDVADGLVNFRQKLLSNNTVIGMLVCRIDVNFNISSQATSDGKAGVDLTVPIQAAKGALTANYQNTSTGIRCNNVLIFLGSAYPELCGSLPNVGMANASETNRMSPSRTVSTASAPRALSASNAHGASDASTASTASTAPQAPRSSGAQQLQRTPTQNARDDAERMKAIANQPGNLRGG